MSEQAQRVEYTTGEGDFLGALKAGYIDASLASNERFAPRFVSNDAAAASAAAC